AMRRPGYAGCHARPGRSGTRSSTTRYRVPSPVPAGTRALPPPRAIALFHPSEFAPPIDLAGLTAFQQKEEISRRAQIDLGEIALEDRLVDDQGLERVEFLLPAGFRQLHDHTVVEDQVPAAIGLALIDFGPRGHGSMLGDGVDEV